MASDRNFQYALTHTKLHDLLVSGSSCADSWIVAAVESGEQVFLAMIDRGDTLSEVYTLWEDHILSYEKKCDVEIDYFFVRNLIERYFARADIDREYSVEKTLFESTNSLAISALFVNAFLGYSTDVRRDLDEIAKHEEYANFVVQFKRTGLYEEVFPESRIPPLDLGPPAAKFPERCFVLSEWMTAQPPVDPSAVAICQIFRSLAF
jgi:hypothetical protein